MKLSLPRNHAFSIELGSEWIADEIDPATSEQLGIYVRSLATGVYLNVRAQQPGQHSLDRAGMVAMLREQNWASPPFDEWSETANDLSIAGGFFETVDMKGEIVIEIFVTDGERIANFAGPAERDVARSLASSVQTLSKSVIFASQ